MKLHLIVLLLVVSAVAGCTEPLPEVAMGDCGANENPEKSEQNQATVSGGGALLASRFTSFDALKAAIKIDYFDRSGAPVPAGERAAAVRVIHCNKGHEVAGILKAGISQGDMLKAQGGGFFGQMGLIWNSPFAVTNRGELQNVMRLARRRQNFFGQGDAAYLDFAEHMVAHITTPEIAFLSPADTSEKGYLNTFNHVTAQAFITSFYSEELADFVGDVHERHNMPELVTGIFSDSQLVDPVQNPTDNYVDMINNEWGQELGKQLKAKYHITPETVWTADLLANYLNDIQAYFTWVFQIGFQPFKPEEEVVFRFTQKINFVLNMHGMEG
jgi:hypothetical protein